MITLAEALLGMAARRWGTVLLIVLSLALFLPGFFTLPPLDRDEARFAQSSRQMVASGDLIDIRYQEVPRYKKPVGIYWLQAATVALTGPEAAPIWKYRLPSLIAAIASVLLTARIARVFAGPQAGLIAGMLMAGVFSLGMEARLAKTDAVMLLTVLVAQAVLAGLWKHARAAAFDPVTLPKGQIAAFWIAIAAGLLVKGPVGPMITLLCVLALIGVTRQARWLAALRPGVGAAIVAVLVLPWVIAITLKSGGAFWSASVGQDMAAKLASGQESHGAPPGTYLIALWLTFFPASVALALSIPAIWRARTTTAILFAAAWAIPGWLVFEAAPTKLTHYVLPMYPALAIAIAVVWSEVVAAPRRLWHWIAFGLISALALGLLIAVGVYALSLGSVPVLPLAAGALALIGGGIVVQQALARRLPLVAALGLALMGLGMTGGALTAAAHVGPIWPAPRIVAAAVDEACPAPTIYTQGYGEPSLVFLSPGPVRDTTPETAQAHLAEPCARVLIPAEITLEGRMRADITGMNLGNGKTIDLRLWSAE